MKKILAEFADVFAYKNQIGEIKNYIQHIILKPDAKPFRGRIKQSDSNFVSRPVMVANAITKHDGTKTYRLCVDFGDLNKRYEAVEISLIGIDTILEWLRLRHTYCSVADISKRFYNITISEKLRQYTAFTTFYGNFHNLVLNVTNALQKSKGLKLNSIQKSNWAYQALLLLYYYYIILLGLIIYQQGIQQNPEKLSAVKNLEFPKDKGALMKALGLFNWFRR